MHWPGSYGQAARQTLLCPTLRRSCQQIPSESFLHSATESTPYCTQRCHQALQGRIQDFRGLSTAPLLLATSSSLVEHPAQDAKSHPSPRGQNSSHSSRSQVRGRLHGGSNIDTSYDAGVRVDSSTSGLSGAVTANTGERRRRGSHSFKSRVGKRSFKRALARAKLEGQTFYRGRVLYPTMRYAPAPRAQANTQQARVQVFSWNAGGLSAEANAELEYFLQTSSYDIALVQETHWSTSGEWAKGDWTFIHSASRGPGKTGSWLPFAHLYSQLRRCNGRRLCRAGF